MTFSCINEAVLYSVSVAVLKQALFTHLMSRETEETEENKQSTSSGNQLSVSLPGSPEGPSAACDESNASERLGKDNPRVSSALTGLSETTERNGKGVLY